MHARPRLKRSVIELLLMLRHRENNVYSDLPIELIRKIGGYDIEGDQSDFEVGLGYVAYGALKEIRELLTDKPFLIFFKNGETFSPEGKLLKNKTLLGCAVGACDPEIIIEIKRRFYQFKNGEKELERQLAPYRSHIAALKYQQADINLTNFFNVLEASNSDDVEAELVIGEAYDWDYKSRLRDELNVFKKEMFKDERRILEYPCVHSNYKNLDYAKAMLRERAHRLTMKKTCLASQQIIGLIQLLELPAYERFVFARGQFKEAIAGEEIERDNQFKYAVGEFSHFNADLFSQHAGLGVEHFINLVKVSEIWMPCYARMTVAGEGPSFSELMTCKNERVERLMDAQQLEQEDQYDQSSYLNWCGIF